MVDFVVVGAGSAGCALAARLTEDPHVDVVLLECGVAKLPREVGIPAAFSELFRSDVDWNYDTEPEEHLAGLAIYWPVVSMLGGSSSMNAMMAIPGHTSDYDGWAALGAPGWSWNDVALYFDRVQETLAVEELRDPNPLTLAFVEAAQQAGIAPSPAFAPAALDGVRLTPVTQRRGRRNSAVDAYLTPAAKRPNLTVRTNTQVTRVVFEG